MSSLVLRELLTKWGFSVDDKALDNAEKKFQRAKKSANDVGDSLTSAFERPRDAQGKFLKYKEGIFAGGGGNGKILGGYHESINAIKESASDARGMILSMGAAFAVGSAGLGGFFHLIGSMEQTEIAFETMIGDADKAKKTLEDLKNFAKTTPFNFADTSELSKRLLAFSFQAEELIPIMTSLGNIAAGVGKEKLPQLVLALGQVKAAGKLRGSELRQFTEAGVPLIAELAKTLHVTDDQVQHLVEGGKVGFKDVWKALQNVTGEGGRFNNLMQRQSGSLLGIFSNIVDTLQLMAVDLGKRGLLGKAKEYLTGFLSILETNRTQIINAMQNAIEITIDAMGKLINIARGVWNVFRGLTSVVGGTRRAMDLLIKGFALITSARLLFLLGKMAIGIAGLAKTWMLAGNAAMWAQIKMALIPIAIGAAIAALALIIEDVVAYFQGRKSITGLILADIDNLGANIEKFLAPVFETIKGFASKIGKTIIDGISAMSQADWGKFADVLGSTLMKALEVILIVSTIPLRIGMAIAGGIIEGLINGLKEKFPKVASFLGLDEQPAILPAPGSKGAQFAPEQSIGGGIMDVLKMVMGSVDTKNYNPLNSGLNNLIDQKKAQQGGPGVNVTAPITVMVPAGTPPEQIAPAVQTGVQKGVEGMLRDAARANKPILDY